MRHRNKENNSSVYRLIHQDEVHFHHQKYQNLHQYYIWSIHLHGCECWTLTKDLERRLEAAENVVHQKNNENIMDWKEVKRISNRNVRIQKIPTQNYQKRTTTNFFAYKQSWWTRKANIEWKYWWFQSRGRQRTIYTGRLNNFVTRKKISRQCAYQEN